METFRNGTFTFPVIDGGPADAGEDRTVVLLHGFPQTSAAWSQVAPHLHEAGLRTLAPDTRGTAPQARPQERSAYRVGRLVDDVMALLDEAGLRSAHVVGHDWGGGIAWAAALRRPERVRSLTVLSTPHPSAMAWALRHSDQVLRSWYMFALQIPVVPEHVLAAGIRRRGMKGLGLPADQERLYSERLSRPEAMAGAIGTYRAMPPMKRSAKGAGDDSATRVTVPTTYVWGNRDPYLGRAAAERTASYCSGPYRFVELDADHWLPEKRPADVAAHIRSRVLGD